MSDLKNTIDQIIADNPKAGEAIKKNPKAINKLVGQVMKRRRNSNPQEVLALLGERFGVETKKKDKKVKTENFTKRCWVHKDTGQEVQTSFVFIEEGKQYVDPDTGKHVVEKIKSWQYYTDYLSKECGKYRLLEDEFKKTFAYTEETITIEVL